MEQLARLRPATILVVENEAIVLMELADWLADVGLTVLTAVSADEAVDLLKTHPEIGLLMTDITMPGSMDGVALAHLAHQSWPLVKIVVTSGRMDPHPDELPTGSVFVPKPLERLRLWRVLSRLMGDDVPSQPDSTNLLPG
jgi:CheY-like chemotaxis protein